MSYNSQLPAEYRPTPENDGTGLIAAVLEIVFGLFGFLGLGWLYVGNYGTSLAAFIGYWILLGGELVVVGATGGLLACVTIPLNLVLVAASGIKAREYALRSGARGSIGHVILAGAIALVLVCGIGSVLMIMFGGLAALGGALDSMQ